MKLYIYLIVAVCLALGCNYALSLVLTKLVRQRATLTERILISSVNDADSIRLKKAISEEQQARLWGDAMNIIMRADNEVLATKYAIKASKGLGLVGAEFYKRAQEIIQARFKSPPVPSDFTDETVDLT